VLEAGAWSVGALFDLAAAGAGFAVSESLSFPPAPLAPRLSALFGRPVDVVAFAATHRPCLARHDGVLFVNPGSPNLPSEGPGTVAILDLGGAEPVAEIREIAG
jgi:predicted phosphodiesterase